VRGPSQGKWALNENTLQSKHRIKSGKRGMEEWECVRQGKREGRRRHKDHEESGTEKMGRREERERLKECTQTKRGKESER
jgi:hypothetical protein